MIVSSTTPRLLLGVALAVAAVAVPASAGCPGDAPPRRCREGCAGWQVCTAAGTCARRPECLYFADGADMVIETGCADWNADSAGQVRRTRDHHPPLCQSLTCDSHKNPFTPPSPPWGCLRTACRVVGPLRPARRHHAGQPCRVHRHLERTHWIVLGHRLCLLRRPARR